MRFTPHGCHHLPGCVTFGKSIDEAMEMIRDAIELYIETLRSHCENVPSDESLIERTIDIKAHA